MSDPVFALQSGLYGALSTALSGVAGVYDHVPQGTAYPYVTFDYQEANNADYVNSRKDSVFVYLAVWSEYRGQKEVLNIMDAIDKALHNQKLPLSTGRAANVSVLSKRTNREPDGLTYMGQVRIKVILEHG